LNNKHIKIVDLGLSIKIINTYGKVSGDLGFSKPYASPELIRLIEDNNDIVRRKTDIW